DADEGEIAQRAEAGLGDPGEAELAAEPALLAYEAEEQEADAHRHDGEEVVPHAQRSDADHHADHAGNDCGAGERDAERRALEREPPAGVGADAVERGVAEAHLAAEAGNDVEAEREDRVD